ncbi:hypothetical protein F-E9_51 [Faustovirus]|nr:hypothetical protein F-E9_51 [Faustovirus]
MSFNDFKQSNLNYNPQDNQFKSLNLPYIAASNFYTPGNIHCASINNTPIAQFGGNVSMENIGAGEGVYAGVVGSGPFQFRSLVADTGLTINQNIAGDELHFAANVGSTSGTVAAGNDARFSTENVLRVKKNPGAGEYSSIAQACAAIVGSNATNPFLVWVGAGIYTEPLISPPPYVSIYGMSMSEVIVEPSGDHDVFSMISPGDVSFLSVRNVPAGRFAFNIVDPGNYALLHKVTVYDSAGGVRVDCSDNAITSQVYIEYMDVSGDCAHPFQVSCTSTNQLFINLENTYYIAALSGVNPTAAVSISGNTHAHFAACGIFGAGAGAGGTALLATNAADVHTEALFIHDFSVGVSSPDDGTAVDLILGSLSISRCTTDISILNSAATGYYSGAIDYPKITINPSSAFYLANRGYNNILVSKRGGDFTSVKAAMDSITNASITNPYTINVDPGVYTEDTITTKPYVSINGSGYAVTHIKTNLASQDLFLSSGQFNLYNCDASCGTDAGCAIIKSFGGLGVDRAIGVRTLGGYHFIRSRSDTIGVAFGIYNCLSSSTANCDTMFYFEDGGNGLITTVIINGFQAVGAQPWTSWVYGTGPGVEIVANNSLINKLNGLGTGVLIENSAVFRSVSVNVRGFDIGFHAPNIGSGPQLRLNAFVSRVNTTWDVLIEHPDTGATILGVAREANVSINPAVTDVSVNITKIDTGDPGIVTLGAIKVGPRYDELVNLVDVVQSNTVGLLSGGALTAATGLDVDVASGRGLVYTTTNYFREIDFTATTLTLPDNTASYIFVNENSVVSSNPARPDNIQNLILGRVYTNSGAIQFIDITPFEANQFGNYLDNYNRDVYGAVFQQGCSANVNASFQLTITNGIYYLSGLQISPSGIAAGATFKQYWNSAAGSWTITDVTAVNNTQYNRISDYTLQSLTASFYTKHSIYVVGQGANEQYFLVIGQGEFATQLEAENSVNNPPSFFIDGVVAVADVVVQQGAVAPIAVSDTRPRPAFAAAIPTGTPTAHAALSGLTVGNDHPQYLLRAGTSPMTGNLALGGNNITTVGTVNGVVVETHGSRHLPNGADPLTTAAPATVGTANAIGVANSFARSDHVHNHGAQTDPTFHAAATSGANGFMIAADKAKLDAATASSTVTTLVLRNGSGAAAFKGITIDTAGTITLNNADASFATTISPAALAQNTSLQLPATNGVAAQALITDGNGITSWGAATPATHASTHLPNGADPLTTAAPVTIGTANSIGVANSFARSDHVHNHGAQTDPSLHAAATSIANGFMIAADKAKLDAATAANTASTIVARDASGNITCSNYYTGANGVVRLYNSDASFYTSIASHPTIIQNYTYRLPQTYGSSGQLLQTDGAGNTSWAGINRIYIPISLIVNVTNNYIIRLGAASALSGSASGITITAGTATTPDYITYTGTIAVASCKINVRFANNNNTWRNWSLNLLVSGTSVTGSSTANKMVPAQAAGWRDSADTDVGGVAAASQISATITWGDPRAITLLSGYLLVNTA